MKFACEPLFTDISTLAAQVNDKATIGVGGLHFCRIPVALLKEVVANQPRGLHYVSWGGGMPLEMLLAGGCVNNVTFCFSSLDVFGMAPLFRRACEQNEIALCEMNALAFIQGLHAAQQHLPFMPYQTHGGLDIGGGSHVELLKCEQIRAAAPLCLDVLLLHASRADSAGNVEIEGALGLDISLAWAARKILVTVEEVVPVGTLSRGGRGVLPREIVSSIAVVPWGAWPTSSPKHYVADFRSLATAFRKTPCEIPAPDSARRDFLSVAAKLRPCQLSPAIMRKHSKYRVPASEPASPAEIMVYRLAQEYKNDSCCSAGAVSPLAIVSYLLAKGTHAPNLNIMTCSGGYLNVGARPMLLVSADVIDGQTATIVCGGEDTYHWYYQRGLVDHEVVSAAQIDRHARTNNQWLYKPDGAAVRLPGQGGMADVANMHANFTLYLARHSKQSLVEKVGRCSAMRTVFTPEERAAAGWANGKVLLVTNLCVFEVNPVTREWNVTSIHPGVSPEQLREATGFPIEIPTDTLVTAVPDEMQLRLIREEIDPLGYRRLEFIPSRQRQDLIDELIKSEEACLAEMLRQEPVQ